jgi:antirestriction protein ArdC
MDFKAATNRIVKLLDNRPQGHESFLVELAGDAWSYGSRQFTNPDPHNPEIERWLARLGTVIVEGDFENPYYCGDDQSVRMPRFAGYRSAPDYFHSLFHEIIHTTNSMRSQTHEARAARETIALRLESIQKRSEVLYVDRAGRCRRSITEPDTKDKIEWSRKHSPEYGREEVVAEIGAMLLLQMLNLPLPDIRVAEHLASYLGQWMPAYDKESKLTNNMKAAIRRAGRNAERAIIELNPMRT